MVWDSRAEDSRLDLDLSGVHVGLCETDQRLNAVRSSAIYHSSTS
jgi:hypothetical protein